MNLSNIPTHKLIEWGIQWSNSEAVTQEIDTELEQRLELHLSDCAGLPNFGLVQYDGEVQQVTDYDENGYLK